MAVWKNLIDLGLNQIKNVVIDLLSSDPSVQTGRIFYNTTTNKMKWSNNAVIIDPLNRATHTGQIVSGDVGDFETEVTSILESYQIAGDINGDVGGTAIAAGVIVNADVNAAAAIAYSKLNLANSIVSGDIVDGTIMNGDINVSAAVAFAKLASPIAAFSFNSQRLYALADPTSTQDAATKGYVDGLVNGISWKESVRVATTANGTLATVFENGDTIDGVALVTGNRILLKNQSAGSENGIYIVSVSGAPTRANDADSTTDIESATVFVEEGTANAGTVWVLSTDNVTVGTTAQVWVQFAAGGVYTGSNGILLTGANFTAVPDPTPATIVVGAGGISVDTSTTNGKIARHFSQNNSAGTSTTVTHNFGTRDVIVQVYDLSTFEQVFVDNVRTSTNVVTVTFGASQTVNTFRIVVIG